MLADRALPGTFYVPLHGEDSKPTLPGADIRSLHSAGFEIGAHTLTHAVLTDLSTSAAAAEITASKDQLQQQLGAPVSMFCYPRGRFNASIIAQVKTAGYIGARTTEMLRLEGGSSPYTMPTTLQAFAHPSMDYFKNTVRHGSLSLMFRYRRELRASLDWVELGKCLFDRALQEKGIFHLWGHSWELEQYCSWGPLAELLDYISRRSTVQYCNNQDVHRYSSRGCYALRLPEPIGSYGSNAEFSRRRAVDKLGERAS
jgi:hypothetical protein